MERDTFTLYVPALPDRSTHRLLGAHISSISRCPPGHGDENAVRLGDNLVENWVCQRHPISSSGVADGFRRQRLDWGTGLHVIPVVALWFLNSITADQSSLQETKSPCQQRIQGSSTTLTIRPAKPASLCVLVPKFCDTHLFRTVVLRLYTSTCTAMFHCGQQGPHFSLCLSLSR